MTGRNNGLEFTDLLAIYSIYLGTRNLIENEQQSDAQIKILRQNDITAANDKQAAYILSDINAKFDEQNAMIRKIMDKLRIKDGD